MIQNVDFCLIRVESSLVGSVSNDSSQRSTSYSDNGTSSTITSLRLISVFTIVVFVQSLLTRVDLSFLLRAMTLKIFFVFLFCLVRLDKSGCVVCTDFAQCTRLCVGCTDFAS